MRSNSSFHCPSIYISVGIYSIFVKEMTRTLSSLQRLRLLLNYWQVRKVGNLNLNKLTIFFKKTKYSK